MFRPFRAKIFIYLIPRAVALGYLLSALWALEEIFLCLNLCNGFYPHPLSIYSLFWTRMNIDFVVMVRQTHHERHCILSLSKDQSNDCQDINYNEPVVIRVYLRKSVSSFIASLCVSVTLW